MFRKILLLVVVATLLMASCQNQETEDLKAQVDARDSTILRLTNECASLRDSLTLAKQHGAISSMQAGSAVETSAKTQKAVGQYQCKKSAEKNACRFARNFELPQSADRAAQANEF